MTAINKNFEPHPLIGRILGILIGFPGYPYTWLDGDQAT